MSEFHYGQGERIYSENIESAQRNNSSLGNLMEHLMNYKSEIKNGQQDLNALPLPELSFESSAQLAKIESATSKKVTATANGGERSDYYFGEKRVFSDISESGNRTRYSYDLLGRPEGKRVDYANGSSEAVFNGDFDKYKVVRNRSGITVMKEVDGEFVQLSDQDEVSDVLMQERRIFTPPYLMGGAEKRV